MQKDQGKVVSLIVYFIIVISWEALAIATEREVDIFQETQEFGRGPNYHFSTRGQ